MTKIMIYADNNLSTRCVHESGAEIFTTAPKDNQGEGNKFSPTDLLATALGSCILTVMDIMARKLGVDLSGSYMHVEKEAGGKVRRVSKVKVEFYSPNKFSEDVQKKLEEAGQHCPVHHSLHPDLVQEIQFHWGVS